MIQALRGAVLPNFNPLRYETIFDMNSTILLNIVDDENLLNGISQMCENTFNAQINCSFERFETVPETELSLVEFLLQTSIDVKKYLRICADYESVVLPNVYGELPEFINDDLSFMKPDDVCTGR